MNESTYEPAETVLDLEELKARCLGNMDLVERVLAKFAGQLDRDLIELETAIASGDATQAAQLAHRIKGIAASVAARSLFHDASHAEEHALENELGELPGYLTRLQDDRMKLLESLERRSREQS